MWCVRPRTVTTVAGGNKSRAYKAGYCILSMHIVYKDMVGTVDSI